MTVHIIGELTIAEKHMELHRGMMRKAKNASDQAQYKREFRKARNRALDLREKIN